MKDGLATFIQTFSIFLVPLLVIGAIGFVLMILKRKFGKGQGGKVDGAGGRDLGPPPYTLCNGLLTPSELRCFRELLQEADPDEYILAKVRLVDVLTVPTGTPNWKSHFNRVAQKHVDFVVCDRKTMRVKALIELDDPSHARWDRMERDEFVEEACRVAGVKLLRVK